MDAEQDSAKKIEEGDLAAKEDERVRVVNTRINLSTGNLLNKRDRFIRL